jgi:hypothetical protein
MRAFGSRSEMKVAAKQSFPLAACVVVLALSMFVSCATTRSPLTNDGTTICHDLEN